MLPTTKNQDSGKYINSPETEIYHKSRNLFGLHLAKDTIRTQNFVIVTEGEFDMISPFQSGIKNIVAIKGTAFTEEQLQLLRRYTDTLVLGLDSDFAGSNAARKSIELADSMEFDIKVLLLGDKYKDPDEAVRADPEFFKKQLEEAVPIWDFIIQSQIKINNPDTIKGKKDILTIVLPFLVKIKNSVIRSDYLKKLANEIGSDYEALLEEAKKIPLNSSANIPSKNSTGLDLHSAMPKPTTPVESFKTEKFEQLLLTLIIGSKNPAKVAQRVKDQLSRFQNHCFYQIGENLLKIEEFDPKTFEELLPAEVRAIFQSIYMETTVNTTESHQRLLEIKKAVAILDNFYFKDRLNFLSSKIAQLEDKDDQNELESVEKEYNKLLSELSKVQIKKS
jgi:DNA primase